MGEECTCKQLIAINKECSNCKPTVLFYLVLGKEKLDFLLPADSYIKKNYLILGTKKKRFIFIANCGWRKRR